jgi:MscS family membrane protein
VNLSILKLAEEMDVRFAFNTQTIHIEDFPEKKSLMPNEYPEREDLKARVSSFESYK